MKRLVPYFCDGLLLCLFGCGFLFLWRKLSSQNSCGCSETTENALKELKSWQRTVESELESQFDRVRSIAGRIDRAKRGKGESQPEPPLESQPDEQGNLNRLLAQKFHGIG